MSGKNNPKLYTYHELYTETYLSSLTNQEERQAYDKNVHKAIKENNVEYLVEKDRENAVENAQLYDEEKELSNIIVQIRKKYDNQKIKTAKMEKNIAFLEEEKHQLANNIDKLQNDMLQTTNNHQAMESKHRDFEDSLENLEYMRDIRLNMGERLKEDILHFKKKCFEDNIRLIRMRTIIKEFQQKDTNKKHMNSKCKLVLNTLQKTVKVREEERQTHLRQVETVLLRKTQNNELKTNRDHELQSSMYKALTQRLPEENTILKKLTCQLFLRRILRSKMNRLMQQFKEVEDAFNKIKKEIKISSASQFIEDYLGKQQRYGDLLNSIGKAQKKIAEEKEIFQELSKERSHLEYESSQIDERFDHMNHKGRKEDNLYKKLVFYNDLTIKCEELMIMIGRWGTRTINALSSSDTRLPPLNTVSNLASLKTLLIKSMKLMNETLNEKTKDQQQPLSTQRKSLNRSNASQEKLNLRTFTQSVLSKECSKKNFRVRTMTTHQQALHQHDNEYDELSQYDFLRFNRKLAKKNNSKTQRQRIKTKPF